MLVRVQIFLHVLRPFAKFSSLWVEGTLEAAQFHFVIVASVDQSHFGVVDQFIPLFRWHVFTDSFIWVNRGVAQCHDFITENNAQTMKDELFGEAFAVRHVGKALVHADISKHGIDSFFRSGDGGVNAFRGEDKGAEYACCFAPGLKLGFPVGEVGEICETVKCSYARLHYGVFS